ncbi:MAG: prolyl oligopeptidase family serine peptidase [Nocardioidaceae bacterium]
MTPSTVYDYVVATGELLQRKQQIVLGDFDPSSVRAAPRMGHSRRRHARTDLHRVRQGHAARRLGTGAAVRLRVVRAQHRPRLLGVAPVAARPGHGVRRRARPRRRGDGSCAGTRTARPSPSATRSPISSPAHVTWPRKGGRLANRLVAEGGSAGGLLMGVVANTAPEAFAGIVANVPFVDALTSILDPSLPLTVIEWDEWGDPLHDREVYAYMKSYTPYENVSTQQYPPVLAITSLNDTRVLYVEPAKWVARLRATAAGDAQVLLKTEMEAGHGGVSGRYAGWKERAYELAWILATSGALGDASAPPAGAAVPR